MGTIHNGPSREMTLFEKDEMERDAALTRGLARQRERESPPPDEYRLRYNDALNHRVLYNVRTGKEAETVSFVRTDDYNRMKEGLPETTDPALAAVIPAAMFEWLKQQMSDRMAQDDDAIDWYAAKMGILNAKEIKMYGQWFVSALAEKEYGSSPLQDAVGGSSEDGNST